MQPQETDVQYSRWNENNQDEVSISVSATETSSYSRLYSKMCTGKMGIAVKVIGGIAAFWIIFIIGYVTGYYVHKCK
ncbi:small integral membrane protein 1 [Latimeria chalumnae]|uniref:Small integral membrane protein 1 (Vel blood group) n=1 Tax=Latimeria chalumnae TaxID=7897 RepID=M3XK85_LATCH|nr:PREDICTED: small integral membrane protein 1 [Latimeria chalumnae]XP_014345395.1 PREDICTED: small integral membrane protein 1 [Latimeria chalumnae]|eukprot:XP_014345360.1 PREDICTED: small integral membrane protein 1 [Latimeria chalumnae]